MKHLNPHCVRWNQMPDEDKYWVDRALDLGGKLQYLIAKERRWVDTVAELPRTNSRHVYRICPDYWIAVQLKDMTYASPKTNKKSQKSPSKPEPVTVKTKVAKKKNTVATEVKRKCRPAAKKPNRKKVRTKAKIKRK